ncbi:proline-rich protein 29 [Clupea harengus]|uniref:Proline-rich protein 29 n=1 Tax=Clupea harengus TaxID=7950 RepID=A0A8M1K4C7_CLUHA|nr:proline-rich protein 29 [Clupea harengus]
MAWIDDSYMGVQQQASNVQIFHQPTPQPTTILQQLPAAMAPPAPEVRPGHVREDLVELMMLQNAQMHQVIMNNMTMSALSSFGYSNSPAPESLTHTPTNADMYTNTLSHTLTVCLHTPTQKVNRRQKTASTMSLYLQVVGYPLPVEEEDPEVYHHHYPAAPYHAYPGWMPISQPYSQPLTPALYTNYGPQEGGEQIQPSQPAPPALGDRRAVPPPPPPSATGTVGADIPPATEYYDITERRQ